MRSLLQSLVPVFLTLVLFASVTNLAALVSPLFMMHVLDRVIPTGNLNTLILLGILAVSALAISAAFELYRDRALTAVAAHIDTAGSRYAATHAAKPAQVFEDVATLSTLIGNRFSTLLDLPWLPLFGVALFLLHPAFLGLLLGFGFLFFILDRLQALASKNAQNAAQQARGRRAHAAAAMSKLGSAADLMGLRGNLADRFSNAARSESTAHVSERKVTDGFGALSRGLRVTAQVVALGLGAALVSMGAISAGGMIGGSIILAKCLGIMDQAIALLPQVGSARQAWRRLIALSESDLASRTEVADLSGAIRVENVTYPRGAGAMPRIERINFGVNPGECLVILGESGSGKSTLLHALAGVDPAPIGTVFLDDTDVRTLGALTRATKIGYLPQIADVSTGTIGDFISRFDPERDDAKTLAAAKMAGIHSLVSALPQAYETDLEESGHLIPMGQKQRIALARALYDEPKYLFMDEPNALLDHDAERQLGDAIARMKSQGVTVVMTVHRTGIVGLADRILVLDRGRIADFGPRAEIMARRVNRHRRIRVGLAPGTIQDLTDWVARQFVRDGDEDFRHRATVVATELYSFAAANGPVNPERALNFEFKFVDDTSCSITLSEARGTKLEAKINKVRDIVVKSVGEPHGLAGDELSLATVMQLSQSFKHSSKENESAFFASITHNLTANELH